MTRDSSKHPLWCLREGEACAREGGTISIFSMVLCHIKFLVSDTWKNEPKGDEEAFETPIQSNALADGDHHEALHPRPGVVRRLLAESCVNDVRAQPPVRGI